MPRVPKKKPAAAPSPSVAPLPSRTALWSVVVAISAVLVSIVFGIVNYQIGKENFQLSQKVAANNEPIISLEAAVNAGAEIVFQTEDVFESKGIIIHEALSKLFFAEGILGMALGKKLVDYKVISQEELDKSKENMIADAQQWKQAKCVIPLWVRLKNTGNRDANLVKFQMEFSSLGGGVITYTSKDFKNILLPANRVIDVHAEGSSNIYIPYLDLIGGDLPEMMGATTEEAGKMLADLIQSNKNFAMGAIDLKRPAKLVFTDQNGNVISAVFQPAAVQDLMRKSRSSG